MLKEVTLPGISENVDSGEVIGVLVSVGDVVEKDQPVVELETEKAAFEVPAPERGTSRGNRREGGTDRQSRRGARQAPDRWRACSRAQTAGEASRRAAGDRGGCGGAGDTSTTRDYGRAGVAAAGGRRATAPGSRAQDACVRGAGRRGAVGPATGAGAGPRHCRSPRQRLRRSHHGGGCQAICAGSSAEGLLLHGLLGGCPCRRQLGRCRTSRNGATSSGCP